MIPPLRPGARLLEVFGPRIETERLILRPWRASDVAANTTMLSDPETARFITPDRKPITNLTIGWRNAAVIMGHWALHGFGLFAVEDKATGRYAGRVGPWCPPGWPGFEVGWGIAKEFRGRGYAVEAARASIDWTFATFAARSHRPLHRPRERRLAGRGAEARGSHRRRSRDERGEGRSLGHHASRLANGCCLKKPAPQTMFAGFVEIFNR